MPNLKGFLNRRLTTREAAVVILLALALTGTGCLIYSFVAARILESKVNAALPKVCADVRQRRQTLVSAIEAYKAHFGFYPPDHVISRQPLVVDAVTNWLVYELVGVIYDPTNQWFQLGGMETADAKFVKDFFHCDGFKNSGERTNQITHFLPPPPRLEVPLSQFHDDPDVYVLDVDIYYEDLAAQVAQEIKISPWRYVSSSPTNNPGKFDLWAEVRTKHRRVTIGNWKAVD